MTSSHRAAPRENFLIFWTNFDERCGVQANFPQGRVLLAGVYNIPLSGYNK